MPKPMLINLELTSNCDYCCMTCLSRGARRKLGPKDMTLAKLDKVLDRVREGFAEGHKISELINAGYGETFLYKDLKPVFERYGKLKEDLAKEGNSIRVSIVTNGSAITEEKLVIVAPALDILKFSFPTAVPKDYSRIAIRNEKNISLFGHVSYNLGLCMKAVAENRLKELRIHISPPCKLSSDDFETTVDFLTKLAKENGLTEIRLVTFPVTSNRAGAVEDEDVFVDELWHSRKKKYQGKTINDVRVNMLSELKIFYPKTSHILQVLTKDNFPCLWKSGSFSIDVEGNYRFCINDVFSKLVYGNVENMSLADALIFLKKTGPRKLCMRCNENPFMLKGSPVERLYAGASKILHRKTWKEEF